MFKKHPLLHILYLLIPSILLGIVYTTAHATTNCRPRYTLWDEKLHLPCVDVLSDLSKRKVYRATLQFIEPEQFAWAIDEEKPIFVETPNVEVGAIYHEHTGILYIPVVDVELTPGEWQFYQVTLKQDLFTGIFSISKASKTNHPPIAHPISFSAEADKKYQSVSLNGIDRDGEFLTYELLSPSSGNHYTIAYLDPDSYGNRLLYVMLEEDFFGEVTNKLELSYRVSDGKEWSEPATITIKPSSGDETLRLGAERESGLSDFVTTDVYMSAQPGLSDSGEDLPKQVDLSDQFPIAGHQGQQNSCVGWAVAYALKSYQENLDSKSFTEQDVLGPSPTNPILEPPYLGPTFSKNQNSDGGMKISDALDWLFTEQDVLGPSPTNPILKPPYSNHVFSPAFIYNQRKSKETDSGMKISEALNLVIKKGAATWETMPYDYSEDGHRKPVTEEALKEAKAFKAQTALVLNNIEDIKTQLASGNPVVVGISIYSSFKYLKGERSVYERPIPPYLGEHAVILVGYNDKYFGEGEQLHNGAFKALNSQGTEWGDNGYFWLPYWFTRLSVKEVEGPVLGSAFVLVDEKNTTEETSEEETSELPDGGNNDEDQTVDLANLQIRDWTVNYDHAETGGQGVLQYTVINSGKATMPAYRGSVELFLSKKPIASSEEYYSEKIYQVTSENLSDQELPPEESITHEGVEFQFPASISPGDYYFNLSILYFGEESNTEDNFSPGDKHVTISGTPYNLETITWKADWDYVTSEGKLSYFVANTGMETVEANIGWDIRLVLTKGTGFLPDLDFFLDQGLYQMPLPQGRRQLRAPPGIASPHIIGVLDFTPFDICSLEENENIVLWQHRVTKDLKPLNEEELPLLKSGEREKLLEQLNPSFPFYVAEENSVSFNIYKDIEGKEIPDGEYSIIFQIDSGKLVEEFDENNISCGSSVTVEHGQNYYQVNPFGADHNGETRRKTTTTGTAYNGRWLPQQTIMGPRVRIGKTREGQRFLEMLDEQPKKQPRFTYTRRSKNMLIYPVKKMNKAMRK